MKSQKYMLLTEYLTTPINEVDKVAENLGCDIVIALKNGLKELVKKKEVKNIKTYKKIIKKNPVLIEYIADLLKSLIDVFLLEKGITYVPVINYKIDEASWDKEIRENYKEMENINEILDLKKIIEKRKKENKKKVTDILNAESYRFSKDINEIKE